jgi:cysteine-rich repeat protein
MELVETNARRTTSPLICAANVRRRYVRHNHRRRAVPHLAIFVLVAGTALFPATIYAAPYAATTTVSLTVCGDALVTGAEFCDDGSNTGAWASSIASRNCNPLCSAYGPYCGDGIIQPLYGEKCDDSNNTAGDLCDPLCQNETDPVVVGGGGSGGSTGGGGGAGSGGNNAIPKASNQGVVPYEGVTDVIVKGRAYPGATITVLRDGEVERVLEANGAAEWNYTLSDQTPGITTFGFWAVDRAGRKSITYSATFQIVENAVTTLSGLLLPPTLAVTPEKVAPGGSVSFAGSAVPAATVRAYVDNSDKPDETVAAGNGEWRIAYDTTPLSAEVFHTVKAHYLDPGNSDQKSGYSNSSSFYVGVRDVNTSMTADLNGDGLVNLTDFSILLFNWNTAGPVGDLNADSTVSLPDFSIMLFYWTG